MGQRGTTSGVGHMVQTNIVKIDENIIKFDFCFKVQLASLTLSEIVVLSQLYVKADLSQRKRFTIILLTIAFTVSRR